MTTDGARDSRKRYRRTVVAASIFAAIALAEIDVYRVRGSSMAPLLDGSSESGDLLVAVAHLPRVRAPRRFDLVIHDRPGSVHDVVGSADVEGDRCVKRIVALAGERPVIRGGDLFLETNGDGGARIERARRDPGTIRAMTAVVDRWNGGIDPGSRFMPSGGFRVAADRVRAAARIDGGAIATRLEYDGLIPDTLIGSDGIADGNGVTVNDTGIELALVEIGAEAVLAIELREQGDLFRIFVGPAIGLRVEYRRGPAPFSTLFEEPALGSRLATAKVLRALNCDDRILVWFDEEIGCDVEYPGNDEVLGVARNDPSFEVVSGAVTVSSVAILRDVYYLSESPLGKRAERFDAVPAGGYFVLGDNSRKSIDSRDYGPIDRAMIRGTPVFRKRAYAGWSGL
jgi:signal peptidase I